VPPSSKLWTTRSGFRSRITSLLERGKDPLERLKVVRQILLWKLVESRSERISFSYF
jgi:hypothetical protein